MALNWDSIFAVALELHRAHPHIDLGTVSLGQIYDWTVGLPDFEDDPALCNDEILESIYQEWYEVITNE